MLLVYKKRKLEVTKKKNDDDDGEEPCGNEAVCSLFYLKQDTSRAVPAVVRENSFPQTRARRYPISEAFCILFRRRQRAIYTYRGDEHFYAALRAILNNDARF